MLPSLIIIVSHILFLYLVRRCIKNSSRLSDSMKDVLLCGVCAFELGCVALEQGVLLEHFGFIIWGLTLVLVVLWQVVGWDEVSPSPLVHIVSWTYLGLFRVGSMLV